MKPGDAKEIASLDATDRIVEKVNTVDSLERFAKYILPTQVHNAFRDSRKEGYGSYFVQAPVGPLSEAMTHAKHLFKGKRGCTVIEKKSRTTIVVRDACYSSEDCVQPIRFC